MRELDELNCQHPEVLPVLQLCAIDKPFFPNLETLRLWSTPVELIPLIPLFLSPRTTFLFLGFKTGAPNAIIASMITALPTLCPNLQHIFLLSLPRHPMITTAVSGMLLTSNRNALWRLNVDSPLTEEAREVVYKHPNIRKLSMVIEGSTSLPAVVLPDLTDMAIEYGHSCN